MNDMDYFLLIIIGIFGYLIGGFVMTLLFIPYLSLGTLNEVGILSFIPLGVFLGIVVFVCFLRQFKIVRRE